MTDNKEFWRLQPIFGVQLLTIILGALDMVLAIVSTQPWPDEEFFLAMTVIAFLFSCICVLGERVYVNESTKVIDMIVYSLSGVILFLSSLIMLVSAVRNTDNLGGSAVIERVLAAALGMCNAVAFCFIGFTLIQELQNSIFPITHTQNKLVAIDWNRLRVTKFVGKFQLLVIVVGAIDVGLTAHSYFRYSEEAIFLSIVVICFSLSLLEFVGSLLGFIKTADLASYLVLIVAHIIGGILLASGGILMVIAVVLKSDVDCDKFCSFSSFDERIVSGILGILNGLLYGAVAYCWYLKSLNRVDNTVYDWDYEDLEPLLPAESPGRDGGEDRSIERLALALEKPTHNYFLRRLILAFGLFKNLIQIILSNEVNVALTSSSGIISMVNVS